MIFDRFRADEIPTKYARGARTLRKGLELTIGSGGGGGEGAERYQIVFTRLSRHTNDTDYSDCTR